MTIRQYLTAYCIDRGMFDDQAKAVVDQMVAEDAAMTPPVMAGRWDDEVEGYPKPLLAVLILSLKQTAIKWIEANKPQAWFKAMFA